MFKEMIRVEVPVHFHLGSKMRHRICLNTYTRNTQLLPIFPIALMLCFYESGKWLCWAGTGWPVHEQTELPHSAGGYRGSYPYCCRLWHSGDSGGGPAHRLPELHDSV